MIIYCYECIGFDFHHALFSTLQISITCSLVNFACPFSLTVKVASAKAKGISQKTYAAVPSFRVFMYYFAKFKFFLQYFIIFITEKVHQLLTSSEDRKKHLFLCLLHYLVKCLQTEDLAHSRLLNLCLFWCLHTNPKFRKASNPQLPLLKKCRHLSQIHLRLSNSVKPKMPFCQPYYWLNQQF